MMKRVIFMIIIVFVSLQGRSLSFQLYVNDVEKKAPLSSTSIIPIKSVFVDARGQTYFLREQNQTITNGIIHLKLDIDETNFAQMAIFDRAGLKLHLQLLGDELIVPMTSIPLAIYSQLADRTNQLKDPDVMSINYINNVINIGGSKESKYDVEIKGTLKADKFVGDGQFVYNARGGGLSDDHSLEKLFSRTCPPNVIRSDCKYGEDVLFINNAPFVGINTKHPRLPFDMVGNVYFTKGEDNTGIIAYPLKRNQSIMLWDHQTGSFKAGYVSRDISVKMDAFSHATVSIGKDIATIGRNSAVFGGEANTIYGDHSAIVGGKENSVTGDYSALVGSKLDEVHNGYVANVGGEKNTVKANYSVLLRAKNNQLLGSYHTIAGENNIARGQQIVINGKNNQVSGNNVIVFGNSSKVLHNNAWVVNVSSKRLAQTTRSNQVIWMADKGISINTSNTSEALVVDGGIKATMIYGNGSQLTNVSLVDKYWLMHGYNMTINGYRLGIKTNQSRSNQVNLGAGLRLTSDTSTAPGTFAYTNGDLIGYGNTATRSLLVQDTDTIYSVSNELKKINNVLHISTLNASVNNYLVFTGQYWEAKNKSLWIENASFNSYSRPVSFWTANNFQGMLTLAHPTENHLVFSNYDKTNGLTLRLSGTEEKNQPIVFGFNTKNLVSNQLFTASKPAYEFKFDSLSGGISVRKSPTLKLMEINRDGVVNFFDGNYKMTVNIPTKSRINKLIIDSGQESSFAHLNYQANPFLSVNSSGRINLDAAATMNFRILPSSFGSLIDQTRMKISSASEVILSHDDSFAIGTPRVVVPDGDLLMDEDRYVGVFNASRELQVGVAFNNDKLIFVPEKNKLNNTIFNSNGFGLRITPNRLISIKDPLVNLYVKKSSKNNASYLKFSQNFIPQWTLHSFVQTNTSHLELKNNLNNNILQIGSKININVPSNPNKDLNIKGDMSLKNSKLFLTGANTQDFHTTPFATYDSSQLVMQPLADSDGIKFISSGANMSLIRGAVAFGMTLSSTPSKSMYVQSGAYITNRLMLNDEKIEYKTIRTPTLEYLHQKENTVQNLSFDYDTGFDISKPEDYVVRLTFQEHFSTFNTVSSNSQIDSTTQIITPNGIDMMALDGDYISISANNVVGQGDPAGDMDQLVFFNDLMNGGQINGDLEIKGTLNVIGNDQNGQIHKFIGNVNPLIERRLRFPWWHLTTENNNLVHFEYVNTENVGIGTATPQYPLEINGISSINIVESPSINVTGEFLSNKDYMTISSEKTELSVTVNRSNTTTGSLLKFSKLQMKDNIMGLNSINDNYTMTLAPKYAGIHSEVYMQSKKNTRLTAKNLFEFTSDVNGDLNLKAVPGVYDFILISNLTSLYSSKENNLGIGILSEPKNSLDVSGNMVIGSDLAGKINAPSNSVMVQGQFGVGIVSPNAMSDINGAMVVATSDTYLGNITGLDDDLVIEDKLFIEEYNENVTENVLIDGTVVGVGGLYFNKHSSEPKEDELTFASRSSSEIAIGYGSDVNDRSFHLKAKDYFDLVPKPGIFGLYINNTANISLGHQSPESLFHVRKNNINFKIESVSKGDAYIKFEAASNGIIGIGSILTENLIISDGEDLAIAGSDFSIDASGNVDIAYMIDDPVPTHNVKVDVNEHFNSTHLRENGAVLTHMPEGSIIMWSGWTSELPTGWKFCTGVDSDETTSKCNMVDQFVVGKETGQTLGEFVGAHQVVLATSGAYDHKHSSNHSHSKFSSGSHGHPRVNAPNRDGDKYTDNATTGTGTHRIGRDGRTEKYYPCHYQYGVCTHRHTNYRWHVQNPRRNAYSAPSNTNHNHKVVINHGHAVDASNNSHDHTVDNQPHTHPNVEHSHSIDNEPEYYKLAFIYLVGEVQ